MHLIMILACARVLNAVSEFIYTCLLCLQKIPRVLSVSNTAIAEWLPQEGTMYSIAPATSFGSWTLWPILLTELCPIIPVSLLLNQSPNYSCWKCLCGNTGSPCLHVWGNSQEYYSWISSPPVMISSAPYNLCAKLGKEKQSISRRSSVSHRSGWHIIE